MSDGFDDPPPDDDFDDVDDDFDDDFGGDGEGGDEEDGGRAADEAAREAVRAARDLGDDPALKGARVDGDGQFDAVEAPVAAAGAPLDGTLAAEMDPQILLLLELLQQLTTESRGSLLEGPPEVIALLEALPYTTPAANAFLVSTTTDAFAGVTSSRLDEASAVEPTTEESAPKGAQNFTFGDGSSMPIPEGSEIFRYPNGSVIIVQPDGTQIVGRWLGPVEGGVEAEKTFQTRVIPPKTEPSTQGGRSLVDMLRKTPFVDQPEAPAADDFIFDTSLVGPSGPIDETWEVPPGSPGTSPNDGVGGAPPVLIAPSGAPGTSPGDGVGGAPPAEDYFTGQGGAPDPGSPHTGGAEGGPTTPGEGEPLLSLNDAVMILLLMAEVGLVAAVAPELFLLAALVYMTQVENSDDFEHLFHAVEIALPAAGNMRGLPARPSSGALAADEAGLEGAAGRARAPGGRSGAAAGEAEGGVEAMGEGLSPRESVGDGDRLRTYKPKTKSDASLPAGAGRTNKYGDMRISPHGTPQDIALARAHELVHSKLSPKLLNSLREFRADLGMTAYKKSALLRYVEEAMAETYAQVSVKGLNAPNAWTGISFPIRNGYVTLNAVVTEAAIGTVVYAGIVYGVYVVADRTIAK